MIKNLTIIGCGLIGSSILRAAIKNNIAKNINIFDKSKEAILLLKEEKLKFNSCDNLSLSVKDSDLIIISTPLSAYKQILLSIKSHLKKGSILTDTGSAKKEINKIILSLNLKNVSWIGSHPIAGTEDSGPKAGFADLFKKRWCIISPSENSKKKDTQLIQNFCVQLSISNQVQKP